MNVRTYSAILTLIGTGACQAESATVYLQGGLRLGAPIQTSETITVDVEEGPAWGVLLHFPYEPDTAVELSASRGVSTVGIDGKPQLEISHLQLGGVKYMELGVTRPFVGASIGISSFRLDSTSDIVRPAYALYGGFEWLLGRHVSLRADVRWLGVYFDTQTTLNCASGCSLIIAPGSWTELEAGLGFGVRF